VVAIILITAHGITPDTSTIVVAVSFISATTTMIWIFACGQVFLSMLSSAVLLKRVPAPPCDDAGGSMHRLHDKNRYSNARWKQQTSEKLCYE